MTVTVSDLDRLVEMLAEFERAKASIEENLKSVNKEIAGVQAKLRSHLIELGRDEYDSPHGKVSMKEEFQVKMPQGDDQKAALWAWMREQGIYDRYATVHAVALKSLFKAERELALQRGEDPVTFALPGMEPATIFEVVKFRPTKK